ncbi:MAG: FGGY-family carbohydrate kinase [Eubacteriales bacterium]|nr:FGGY-family carbohydrate kinase [Eubacteriales bacterium]
MKTDIASIRQAIEAGKTALGIELGSTRIKAVLINEDYSPIASGGHDWENSLVDQIWTYSLDDVWAGVQASYRNLAAQVSERYGVTLRTIGAIGFSGMMHGYVVFDKDDHLLTPFRTWRNTITGQASEALTKQFNYPIPQRWSIAHLYQAILNREAHRDQIDFMTTIAGYVHWQLTGRKVLGVGEASGVFPIDLNTRKFDTAFISQFDQLVADQNLGWKLGTILPDVLAAGEQAGSLTTAGALLLDPSGQLQAGIPFCPPEGDAGTGMVATNSIAVRTGNVSAGTSVFAMIVLEKALSRAYSEIDLVTTPAGDLVAMAHSNNCTSDYDAWINLFGDAANALGAPVSKAKLYDTLLNLALEGDPDCGGLLAYGYVSGEHMTHFEEGRPLFVRSSQSHFSLANFMRVNLFTALGALRTGLDILFDQEGVLVDEIKGHGGFFKTKGVGQKIMAAATHTPISVLETAGEGGAWGIAILAAYCVNDHNRRSLSAFLKDQVFIGQNSEIVLPDPQDVAGFNVFFKRYHAGLAIEKAAVNHLR